jgi:membrane AbrB-like protein
VTAAPTKKRGANRIVSFLVAIAIGTAGGALFQFCRLPLAWMLGALFLTTIAALARAPVSFPWGLRSALQAILGVMVGTSFTPDLIGRIAPWSISLSAILVYIGATGVVVYTYLRRRAGLGPITSYFTAMPGGLNEMTMMGAAMGGDDRIIVLSHSVRLTLVVFTIPFWFRFFEGYVPPPLPALGGSLAGISALDAAALIGCAVAGPPLARLLRIPAPSLTGALALSAILHITGMTGSRLPPELVMAAQVGMGTALGCRFRGFDRALLVRTIGTSFVAGAMMVVGTVLLSLGVHALTGVPTDQLLLAYAPGGLAEMSLIAISLGMDTAFVSTHQLIRIIMVIVLAPLFFRMLPRQGPLAAERPAPGDDD